MNARNRTLAALRARRASVLPALPGASPSGRRPPRTISRRSRCRTSPCRSSGPRAVAATGPVAFSWLAQFGDARLHELVTEAMQHNPDLQVAAARVQVAFEYANLASSTLWPQVNLLARGGGEMGGDASGLRGRCADRGLGARSLGRACAPRVRRRSPATSPSSRTLNMPGSPSPRWSRSRISSRWKPACSSGSPRRWSRPPSSS